MGFTIYVCYQNDMNNFAAYRCFHYVVASIAMAFNVMTSQCILSHYCLDCYLPLFRYCRGLIRTNVSDCVHVPWPCHKRAMQRANYLEMKHSQLTYRSSGGPPLIMSRLRTSNQLAAVADHIVICGSKDLCESYEVCYDIIEPI